MSADIQRKAYRYTCNMIRPQIYSEKSLMESVVDFFSDVVPQAYSSTQKVEDKEKIQWVRFESCDCNDISKNPDLYRSDTKGLPLLLILGYSNGVQIWHVTSNGEAQELMSIRQGPVRIFRVLPNPDPALGYPDAFANKRPLAVLCDSSSAGQPYCGIKFVSLRTGDEVHSINYKNLPVQTIDCNKRFLIIVFLEKICVYETCQFKQLFWVTSCFPCPGPAVNPVALSSRWLAYADKRLVAMHQSCGGMSGDGSQSYAATVISAAKGAFKGMSMFGEAIVNSVTGCKTPGAVKKQEIVHLDNGNRPGIVTVVDIQNVHNDHFNVNEDIEGSGLITHFHAHANKPVSNMAFDTMFNVNEDNEGSGLIAHFHAHANEPVSNMAFDTTGTLLVTACKLGHNFHVFRLMAHPCTSSLGAVHHLYTLHRGDTTAKVIDISFNHDSRWVTVSTHRGTTHIFPITPYGGPINVRTHCQAHIVNRASRFHKSAGLEDIERSPVGRRSPILSTSPSSSGPSQYDRYPTLIQQNTLNNNFGNPRLPPYPHPATVYPLYQIKQPLNVALTQGGNKNTASPSHSPTSGQDNVYSVCAKFCSPRLCVIGSPKLDVDRRESGRRPVDSLYIMTQSGTLVEYILEPKARMVVLDKVTEDCTLDLAVTGRMQWNLQRLKASQELRPPLPSNSPMILAHEAVTSQIPTAADLCDHIGLTRQDSKDSLSSDHSNKDDDEQWLAQVEIITHAGPHRRLWMGPQFSFKTYQEHTTVLSSGSSALLSQSPESNLAAMDITGEEGDLDSLKVQPARSNPVTMPTTRPAYRRLSGSDSSPSPGLGQITPLMIEAGSFEQSPHLLDVYSNWTESTVEKQPRGGDDVEEDRLKQTLADAMVESPCKDIEKLSLRQDITRPSVTNGKKKNKAQEATDSKKQMTKATTEKAQKKAAEPVAGGSKSVKDKATVKTDDVKQTVKQELTKGKSDKPVQKEDKGKNSDTARKQESKDACVAKPQETVTVAKQEIAPKETKESSKTEKVVQAIAIDDKGSSSTTSKDEASKNQTKPDNTKRANGKKGKQDSRKMAKASRNEKSKSEVRFAPEEEIITEKVSRKELETNVPVPDSSSETRHSPEPEITESIDGKDKDSTENKALPQTVEEKSVKEDSVMEEETGKQDNKSSGLDLENPMPTKEESQNSTSQEALDKDKNSSSKSKSKQKNSKTAATRKEKGSSEERDASITEVDKSLSEMKKSTKASSPEANENVSKSKSRSKSARKSLERSFVEPTNAQSDNHIKEKEKEKESMPTESQLQESQFEAVELVSNDSKPDIPSSSPKEEEMEVVELVSPPSVIDKSDTRVTKEEILESHSSIEVDYVLEPSESKSNASIPAAIIETAEAVSAIPESSMPKKEDGFSTKEKKKKKKNGRNAQENLKTEESKENQTEKGKAGKAEESKENQDKKGNAGKAEESKANQDTNGKVGKDEESKEIQNKNGKAGKAEESKENQTEKGKAGKADECKEIQNKNGKAGKAEESKEIQNKNGKAGKAEESKENQDKKGKVVKAEESKENQDKKGKVVKAAESKENQDKKGKGVKEKSPSPVNIQDQLNGNTIVQTGKSSKKQTESSRKQTDKEENSSKQNKKKNEQQLEKKQAKQPVEVLDTDSLVGAAANISVQEKAAQPDPEEINKSDNAENTTSDTLVVESLSSEIESLNIDDFPKLSEKVEDKPDESMVVVKSKKNRKKKNRMEESEYFDTTESFKDLEIEPATEKPESFTDVSCETKASSCESLLEVKTQDAGESVATKEVVQKSGDEQSRLDRKAEPEVKEDDLFVVKSKKKKKKKKNVMEDSMFELKPEETPVQDNEKSIYVEAIEDIDDVALPLTDSKAAINKSDTSLPSPCDSNQDNIDGSSASFECRNTITIKEELTYAGKTEDCSQRKNKEKQAKVKIDEIPESFEASSWETEDLDDVKSPSNETLIEDSSPDDEIIILEEDTGATGGVDNTADVKQVNSTDRSSEERENKPKLDANSERSSEERETPTATTVKAQPPKADSKNKKKKKKNRK